MVSQRSNHSGHVSDGHARPDDNGLDFNFEHQVKAVSREKLEYLYYYLCKIMFKGVENPNLSVGDIIKLV